MAGDPYLLTAGAWQEWSHAKLRQAGVPLEWARSRSSSYGHVTENGWGDMAQRAACSSYSFSYNPSSFLDAHGLPGLLDCECHRTQYGSSWYTGRANFAMLLRAGLRPDHTVVDLGCGTLKPGIHMIRYLNEGRYYGIDRDCFALGIAITYEVPMQDLQLKDPAFLCTSSFDVARQGEPNST